MEFRVFFPVLEDADLESNGFPAQLNNYQDELQRLDAEFVASRQVESRADDYFVYHASCGLKYRSGKKLEIKIKTKDVSSVGTMGFEEWHKRKLGKKSPEHYIPEITELLRAAGHEECGSGDNGDNSLVPSFSNTVSVQKERRRESNFTSGLLQESTRLFASLNNNSNNNSNNADMANKSCSIENSSGGLSPASSISRNKWLSICIEGSNPENLQREVCTSQSHLRLRKILKLYNEILSNPQTSSFLAARCLIPIISGYPLWVKVVAGQQSSSETQAQLVSVINNLVAHPDFN